MKCKDCGTINPAGAKFCMNCGQALEDSCPECGTIVPSQAAFCFNCGHRLSPPSETDSAAGGVASADTSESLHLTQFVPQELLSKLESARASGVMEGERRIVTMLFCDVKGSTAAASKLDPEEWADIMNGAFEYLITPVYRYEGYVARLMGDSILAFFGAPIAHEDDPQRAVLAGLEIHDSIETYCRQIKERWGFEFDIRVGINTGLVVVGSVGSDLRMEYSALGDAINLASRMEQTAQPGTVRISEHTYKLVAPIFDVEDLGGIDVKGKNEPVHAYRILGRKSDPGPLRGIQGLDSPLVGRAAELETLLGVLKEIQLGQGQVVSVIGDAGLGKSRLIAELYNAIKSDEAARLGVRWIEGRALSYQTSTPYTIFSSLFKNHFGIQPDEDLTRQYGQIQAAIEDLAPGRGIEVSPFIASLLGIPLTGAPLDRIKYLEPPILRSRVFAAVKDYLEILARNNPTILVFDDLHWADTTSIELLEEILHLTDQENLMIIGLFRPFPQDISWEYHEFATREFGDHYLSIHLTPLPDDAARELVGNLLYIEGLPDEVRNLILMKAEGNPFFVEEVIRSLLDAQLVVRQNGTWRATAEISHIAVPETLAAVITTRLDRLDDDTRLVLQTASVIGRQFSYDTLASLFPSGNGFDDSLTDLERRELIRETIQQPHRTFMFKHTLTQETAYSTLLLKKRRELHRQVGELLEITEPDKVNELAHHFLEAREPERALPYLVESGERATQVYSSTEGQRWFNQAIEILENYPDASLMRRAFEGLGAIQTFGLDIPSALATYQKMLNLAEQDGDIPTQVSALNKLARIYALMRGDFQTADQMLQAADQRAKKSDDAAGLSEMSLIRCMMCTAVADFEGVVRYMDETVDINREFGNQEQISLAFAHIASSQAFMLNFEESWSTLQEGLQLSREIGDREHEADHLSNTMPINYWVRGNLGDAIESAEQGLKIATEIGSMNTIPFACRNLGFMHYLLGDYERSMGYFNQYLDVSRSAGIPWTEVDALCFLGSVYLDISHQYIAKVLEFHNLAEKLIQNPGGAMMGATAWAEMGFCFLAVGKPDRASEMFHLGLTRSTITQNLEKPRLLYGQALVAMDQGEPDSAQGYLREGELITEQFDIKPYYPLFDLGNARLKYASGDPFSAVDLYQLAEEAAAGLQLRPLQLDAQIGAAEILFSLGEIQKGEAKKQEAVETTREIADLFTNREFHTTYMSNINNRLNIAKN